MLFPLLFINAYSVRCDPRINLHTYQRTKSTRACSLLPLHFGLFFKQRKQVKYLKTMETKSNEHNKRKSYTDKN